MICRNCSALIEDGCEKCPVCHKKPYKRNGGSKGKAALVAVLVFVLLAVTAYLVCSNRDLVKEKIDALLPAFSPKAAETTVPAKETAQSGQSEPEQSEDFSLLKAEIKISALEKDKKRVALYGTVSLKKSQLKALSGAELSAFWKSRAEGSSLAWLTLKCEDKTGIVLHENGTAVYGRLGKNDYVNEVFGIILTDSAGEYVYVPLSGAADSSSAAAATKKNNAPTEKQSATKSTTETTGEKSSSKRNVAKDSEKVVFIEKGVKCYHKSSCRLLSKAKKSIAKTEAVEKGYTRCKKCKP